MRLAIIISVALLAPTALAAVPAAAQDIATGQILYNQRCSYCHSLTRTSQKTIAIPLRNPEDMVANPDNPGGRPPAIGRTETISVLRQGPDLSGLLNFRKPGGLATYAYAEDYSVYGPEWTPATLDAWIEKHDDGLTGINDRTDIIGYLRTLRTQ